MNPGNTTTQSMQDQTWKPKAELSKGKFRQIQDFTEESIAERDQETLINRKDFVGLVLDLTKGLFVRLLAFWFSAQPKACILVILLLFQEYINITRNNICIKTLFIHRFENLF